MNVDAPFTVHTYDPYDDHDQWPEKGLVFSSDVGLEWIKRHIKSFVHEQIMASRGTETRIEIIESKERFDFFNEKLGNSYQLSEGRGKLNFPIMWPAVIGQDVLEITVLYYIIQSNKFGVWVSEHKYKLDRKTVLE